MSVAMASYNGEKYIKEQVETILQNLRQQDELIISDDGSTDKTIEKIKKLNDDRIKILKGPQKGLKKNFENAIQNCNGDIIFLSDQDDVWLENKVDKVLEYFNNNDYILIQHNAIVVDSENNILFSSFAEHRKVKTGVIKNLIKNSYHGCCIAFKKELIKEILPIPDNIYLHDEWIGLVGELNGKTCFIDDKLIKYRRHSENNSSFKHLTIGKMLKNRINYTNELLRYIRRRKKC